MRKGFQFFSILLLFLLFSFQNYEKEKSWISDLGSKDICIKQDMQERVKFQNEICLPAKLYMLSEIQNDIFVEPLIKRWRPYDDVVRFSGTANYQRRLQRVASICEPVDSSTVSISLINLDYFDTIKTVTSSIVVGKKGIGSDTVTVSIIGDSFTQGAFYKDALLVKGYVPKIKMIGLRDISPFPGQFDEGRGGWTLAKYFTVSTKRGEAYNGFFQPDGNFKFWGSTEFWKLANAIRIDPGGEWTFGERYNAGRFTTRSLLFDEKTGYKLNPERDDIMFDNLKDTYVRYDGESWKRVNYTDFNWDLDYGKYLSMWRLEPPSIVVEFLGLNDFRGAENPSEIDFSEWNLQIEKLAASYLKAVPNGKFALMIPSSTCGLPDNVAGDFTIRQNACMWELRKNIIEKFDNREKENIFVIDAAITIDNLNGLDFTTDPIYTTPYHGYQGTERVKVQKGNPHPYLNYPNMGIPLAAFIQRYR
ncbi:MAG: hypothetical protein ACOYD8_04855 [Petrimonas mucosa]|jgi:hypothetical protein|uniref:hypothetical protein n=1 Tax=Petrimonas mucosa TaxID=1642646 RepID=UPI003D92D270